MFILINVQLLRNLSSDQHVKKPPLWTGNDFTCP